MVERCEDPKAHVGCGQCAVHCDCSPVSRDRIREGTYTYGVTTGLAWRRELRRTTPRESSSVPRRLSVYRNTLFVTGGGGSDRPVWSTSHLPIYHYSCNLFERAVDWITPQEAALLDQVFDLVLSKRVILWASGARTRAGTRQADAGGILVEFKGMLVVREGEQYSWLSAWAARRGCSLRRIEACRILKGRRGEIVHSLGRRTSVVLERRRDDLLVSGNVVPVDSGSRYVSRRVMYPGGGSGYGGGLAYKLTYTEGSSRTILLRKMDPEKGEWTHILVDKSYMSDNMSKGAGSTVVGLDPGAVFVRASGVVRASRGVHVLSRSSVTQSLVTRGNSVWNHEWFCPWPVEIRVRSMLKSAWELLTKQGMDEVGTDEVARLGSVSEGECLRWLGSIGCTARVADKGGCYVAPEMPSTEVGPRILVEPLQAETFSGVTVLERGGRTVSAAGFGVTCTDYGDGKGHVARSAQGGPCEGLKGECWYSGDDGNSTRRVTFDIKLEEPGKAEYLETIDTTIRR